MERKELMKRSSATVNRQAGQAPAALSMAALVLVLVACTPALAAAGSGAAQRTDPSQRVVAVSETLTPAATEAPLKPLKIEPESGIVGTPFTITADGIPAGKQVEFVWATWQGSYDTKPTTDNVEFYDRTYVEKSESLGSATADSVGRATLQLTAPEDYGQVHDIYAMVDGAKYAHGGFRIVRNATIASTSGPVGAPITITITGLGMKPYEMLSAITWDNKYTGFASGVTNKGTAIIQMRAAGPVGRHLIQAMGSSHTFPYLNLSQSPLAGVISDFSWVYTVTEDDGPPADALDWPDPSRVAPLSQLTSTTSASGARPAAGVQATIEPGAGPVLSEATVKASGLPPEAEVGLLWVTSRGNRLSPSGWSMQETPLGQAKAGADGSLQATVRVPDDLGGWHVVKLVQGERVLAEVPYRVEISLIDVTPKKVKVGETFTIHLKGVGWTELDNAFAVTYDNGHTGYACGFNSNGDIQLTLTATGAPGTHLVDLYPMIYQGHGKGPWAYEVPMLTYARDHPGLALGYRLPAVRAAVEIVE